MTTPSQNTDMKNNTICTTCGTQFPETEAVPELCPICNDDRQFINPNGQAWTNTDHLKSNYRVKITQLNERLYTLKMEPEFAIGQRAFLVLSPNGNVLWDCISLLDQPTIDFINAKGGLKAIAFSHPHFYTTMNEWAAEFNCPVYIHHNDKEFNFYPGTSIQHWQGEEKPIVDDIRMVHIGGHFPGSCVLHIGALSPGGSMLCGDTLYISRSKRHTAVMYSYPNQIPLSRDEFSAMYKKCAALSFDSLYGATFEGQELLGNAREIFERSMKRYIDNYQL